MFYDSEEGGDCMMGMHKRGYMKCATHLGVFLASIFVVCYIWYWVQPAQRELHQALLELTFLGWSGMNATSFISGIVQSFIWGYIFAGLWFVFGCKHRGCCSDKKK